MGTKETIHEGRNIKCFREMLGIKQETLAYQLGEDWTQKKVSQLEAKETIEQHILEQVAKIINVTPIAIQKFNKEVALNYISKTFTDLKGSSSTFEMNDNYFNPVDKLLETLEENKKLREEIKQLYERLLLSEREKAENFCYLFNSFRSLDDSFLESTTALKTIALKGTSFLSVETELMASATSIPSTISPNTV